MSDFHWKLREHLHELRKDERLFVLMSIYLHHNIRFRSFPTNELVSTETGLTRAPISAAIHWFIEHKAFVLVPYGKRVGEERRLAKRKNIYQLTGILILEGQVIPYLFLNPDSWHSIYEELGDLGESSLREQLLRECLAGEHLQGESSRREHEVVKDLLSSKDSLSTNAAMPESSHIPFHIANGLGQVVHPQHSPLVLAVKAHPAWLRFVMAWDGIVPEVEPATADIALIALNTLQTDVDNGLYTLDDIEATTRWRLSDKKLKGYRITFVKADIPQWQRWKRAQEDQSAPPVKNAGKAKFAPPQVGALTSAGAPSLKGKPNVARTN